MGVLSKLRRKGGTLRALRSRKMLHLPDDLVSPEKLAVVVGRRREDIWAAIFLMHSLQRNFPDNTHFLICREGDGELAGTLQWLPETIYYSETPRTAASEAGEALQGKAILFHPYREMDSETAAFIAATGVGVCVSTAGDPVVNLRVKVQDSSQPERLFRMCEVLGIEPDREWSPAVPSAYISSAAAILAPVSGRALPYIAATTTAANLLEKQRAEIPVRMVIVEGKRREIPEVSRGVMAAIVGGASAVVTSNPGLWLKARALNVPVVGLDRNGRFPDWGGVPAQDDAEFITQWSDLLRRGW